MYCSHGDLRQMSESNINQFYLFYLTVGQKNVLDKIFCQDCGVINADYLVLSQKRAFWRVF